jgi:hypothetical protein
MHEQLLVFAAEGRQYPAARAELVPLLCARLFDFDPELARGPLLDWRVDEPGNARPTLLLAQLELHLGNRETARETAERVLLREPGNKEALQVLAQARKREYGR